MMVGGFLDCLLIVLFVSHVHHIPLFSLIWRSFIPTKYSYLLWRVLHNRLATDKNLKKCGIVLVSSCLVCFNVCCGETSSHLFVYCDFTVAI